jgi:magnesium transporter
LAEAPRLALAFLEERPESAARSLESLEPADAAALLELVPVRIAAPAVARMASWAAARCISGVSVDRGCAVMAQLRSRNALAILRLLPPSARDAVLGGLPGAVARHYRRSLAYPRARVGAWVDFDVAALEPSRTVGDALDLIAARRRPDETTLFVVDAARKYVGAITVPALLHFPRRTEIATLADRQVRALADSASLAAVAADPAWTTTLALPVTNRQGELLGALTRVAVEKGLHDERLTEEVDAAEPSVVLHVLEAYLAVLAGLTRLSPLGGGAGGGATRRTVAG